MWRWAEALLDGLNFLFEKDSMTVDYKGLKVTMDPAQLPDSAIAKLLVSAIDQAAKKDGVSVSFEDTALVISGETADSTFYLKIDAADANVMTLSVPAEGWRWSLSTSALSMRRRPPQSRR